MLVQTFIAVSDGVEVDVVLVITDEEQTKPGVKGINWHNKEDPDDVTLLIGDSVGPEVCVDLQTQYKQSRVTPISIPVLVTSLVNEQTDSQMHTWSKVLLEMLIVST